MQSISFQLKKQNIYITILIQIEGKDQATALDSKFIETSSALKHNVDELLVGVTKQMFLRKEQEVEKKEVGNEKTSRVHTHSL